MSLMAHDDFGINVYTRKKSVLILFIQVILFSANGLIRGRGKKWANGRAYSFLQLLWSQKFEECQNLAFYRPQRFLDIHKRLSYT